MHGLRRCRRFRRRRRRGGRTRRAQTTGRTHKTRTHQTQPTGGVPSVPLGVVAAQLDTWQYKSSEKTAQGTLADCGETVRLRAGQGAVQAAGVVRRGMRAGFTGQGIGGPAVQLPLETVNANCSSRVGGEGRARSALRVCVWRGPTRVRRGTRVVALIWRSTLPGSFEVVTCLTCFLEVAEDGRRTCA